MVIPRVAWTWYAAWCLPFLLLVVTADRRRMTLLVIILALFSLQPGILIVAAGAILGLLYLLWIWRGEPSGNGGVDSAKIKEGEIRQALSFSKKTG
jgi:hypothetical protein